VGGNHGVHTTNLLELAIREARPKESRMPLAVGSQSLDFLGRRLESGNLGRQRGPHNGLNMLNRDHMHARGKP